MLAQHWKQRHDLLRTTVWRSLYEAGAVFISLAFLVILCALLLFSLG
jgi:hypothetical protein